MQLKNISIYFVFLMLVSGSLSSQTYYWVGITGGDWHDEQNWSFDSGGFPGAGIPNASTDVVFDAMSFNVAGRTVTITVDANCRSLDMRNIAQQFTFTSNAADTLSIDGSFYLSPDVTFDIQSPIEFRSSDPGNEIQLAGHPLLNDVIFKGLGGEWTLLDDFDQIAGEIRILEGSLNTNDNGVTTPSIQVPAGTANVGLDLGSSIVTILGPVGTGPQMILANDNLNFDGTNSIINFFGEDALLELTGDIPYSFGAINFVEANARLRTVLPTGSLAPFINELTFNRDGLITGDHIIQTLTVANQYTLLLENGARQTIGDILSPLDQCFGDARIIAQMDNGPMAMIQTNTASFAGPFFMRGIEGVRTGTITVFGGYDGGNNSGFNFNANPNIYYWIGNGGSWNDPNNWSRTSGGTSDGCIPKSVDIVIFDDNSFPGGATAGFEITSDIPIYINAINFLNESFVGAIRAPSLHMLAGEQVSALTPNNRLVVRSPFLQWNIPDVYITSIDQSGSTGNTDNFRVEVTPSLLNNIFINGDDGSRVRLDTALIVRGTIDLTGGEFFTNGYDVAAESILAINAPARLRLDSSTITINGIYDGVNYPLTIDMITSISARGTTWIYTQEESGFSIDQGSIGDVVFENNMGTARMLVTDDVTIGTLTIMNDGSFGGADYAIDSLIFSPGHTYVLEGGVDVNVDSYFEGRGDECNPITFRTSGDAIDEDFTMASDISLVLSFMRIFDVSAIGGGSFFAGQRSEGIRTDGWTFPTDEENRMAREFLGEDVVACNDSIITLSPFDASAIMDIRWAVNGTDVSSDLDYTIDITATQVIAFVTTPSGCPISDTIDVDFAVSFELTPMMDRQVCQGATTLLDPGFSDATASYTWSTIGSTDVLDVTETISVSETANYTVEVDRGGCVERDTVEIERIDLEPFADVFDGLTDLSLCSDDSRTFTAPNFTRNTTSYEWNDATSTNTIDISEATQPADSIYYIAVTEGVCSDTLRLKVSFDPVIIQDQVIVNMDTTICAGDEATLSVAAGFDSVSWNNGLMDMTIPVDRQNTVTYVAEVFRGVCRETAERTVTVTQLTDVSLGADIVICEDETLQIPKRAGVNLPLTWRDSTTQSVLSNSDTLDVPIVVGRSVYILEAEEGLCFSRDTIAVTIEAAPILNLNTTDTTICINESLDLIVATEPDVTYTWSTNETGATITVTDEDAYELTAERGRCTVDTFVNVGVLDLGAFSIGPADTTLCMGDVLSLDATLPGSVNYTWSVAANTGPTLEVSSDDRYTVEVSSGNCSVNDTIDVAFDTPIDFELTQTAGSGDTIICAGSTLSYPAFSFQVAEWTDLTSNDPLSSDPTFAIADEGSYELAVTNGVCVTRDTVDISVEDLGTLDIGPRDTTLCLGEMLSLDATIPGNVSYEWSIPVNGPIIDVNTEATYDVRVSSDNCFLVDTISLTIDMPEIFDLNQAAGTSDTIICAGETLSYPSFTFANAVWSDLSGNELSTDPAFVIENEGSFELMVTNGVCVTRDTINMTILDLGSLDIGPRDTTLCLGETLSLDATLPGMLEYQWSVLGVGPIAITGSVFDVNSEGTYDVRVSSPNCSVADTIELTFDMPAVFDLNQIAGATDTTICAGTELSYSSFTFADAVWNDLGSNDMLSTDPTFGLADAGSYELTVTTGVCVTSDTINLLIQELPILDLQDSYSACQGEQVNLSTSVEPNVTYEWSTGETGNNINVSTDGMYSVMATLNNCVDTNEAVVVFNSLPTAILPEDTDICDGDSILLFSLTDIPGMSSTNIENGLPIRIGESFFANSAADYELSITNQFNCTTLDTFTLTINPTPFITLPDSTGLCDGDSRDLSPIIEGTLPANTEFLWSSSETTEMISVQTTNQGVLYVDAFVDYPSGRCFTSDTTFVSVQAIPDVELSAATATICSDSLLVIGQEVPGVTYLWSTGETTAMITVSDAATYSVVVDIKGCTDTDDIDVTTVQAPEVNIGMDTTICEGEPIVLSTGNGTWNTLWSSGETTESITVSDGGTFSVSVEDNGCFDTDEITIATSALPIFDLGDDIEICDQVGTTLSVDLPNTDVMWSTGEAGASISVQDFGTYTATAISSDGCEFEDVINITFRECSRFGLYQPNVFSPSASISEDNRRFFVTPSSSARIDAFEINIFDRWGNKVYTSTDINEGWDGTTTGFATKGVNPGVYMYSIKVTYSDDFDTNRTDVFNGDVTLVD